MWKYQIIACDFILDLFEMAVISGNTSGKKEKTLIGGKTKR